MGNRLFLACFFPLFVQDAVQQLQAQWRQLNPHERIKWIRPAQCHLTLKFLGDVTPNQQRTLEQTLTELWQAQPAFSLFFEGFDAFPHWQQPQVLFWGMADPQARLQQIVQHLEEALQPLGFAKEKRHFTPHITLGRIKHVTQALNKPEVPNMAPVTLTSLDLVSSALTQQGSCYTILRRYPMQEDKNGYVQTVVGTGGDVVSSGSMGADP